MKKTIEQLNKLGYKVYFTYTLKVKDGSPTLTWDNPANIKGKFLPGGEVKCTITKTNTEPGKFFLLEDYYGKAICNPVDKFIPRIGRAIAFKRALALVPEFNAENK